MKETGGTRDRIDRRGVLKSAGAATGLVFGATSATSTGETERVDRIELETDEYPAVEHAAVARDASDTRVRYQYQLRTTRDGRHRTVARSRGTESDGAATHAERTRRTYSFSFGDDTVLGTYSTGDPWRGDEHSISLETADESIETGDASTDGGSDGLETEWDGVAWAETNSRECGTLARTTQFVVVGSTGDGRTRVTERGIDTQSAAGDTCEGEEFGDHFPCEVIPPPLRADGCNVGEQFDTTWNVESAGRYRDAARATFTNTDFPYLSGTSYVEQRVRVATADTGSLSIDRRITHSFESTVQEPVNERVQSSLNEYLLTPSFGELL